MKKVFLLLFGLMVGLQPIIAEETSWLSFRMMDNSELSVEASDLTISYDDGNLIIIGQNVNQSLSVANLKSMQFTSEPAGLKDLVINESAIIPTYLTLNGQKVGNFKSIEDARMSLGHGVYIIKYGKGSVKIIF